MNTTKVTLPSFLVFFGTLVGILSTILFILTYLGFFDLTRLQSCLVCELTGVSMLVGVCLALLGDMAEK